jgi:hypothetical protein
MPEVLKEGIRLGLAQHQDFFKHLRRPYDGVIITHVLRKPFEQPRHLKNRHP